MAIERKELYLNKDAGPVKYAVDIPLIYVSGDDYPDVIDSVVEYIKDHADELFYKRL